MSGYLEGCKWLPLYAIHWLATLLKGLLTHISKLIFCLTFFMVFSHAESFGFIFVGFEISLRQEPNTKEVNVNVVLWWWQHWKKKLLLKCSTEASTEVFCFCLFVNAVSTLIKNEFMSFVFGWWLKSFKVRKDVFSNLGEQTFSVKFSISLMGYSILTFRCPPSLRHFVLPLPPKSPSQSTCVAI